MSIEQDAAYWELHIEIPAEGDPLEVLFGVATKKDRKFYNALDDQEESTCDANDLVLLVVGSKLASRI